MFIEKDTIVKEKTNEARTRMKKSVHLNYSMNNQFTIVMPDLTNEEGVDISDECLTVVNESQDRFSKYSKKILAFCYGKQRTIREITEELNLSNSTYFKQEFLNPLVESGLLTSAKIGNALAYRTNHDKVSLS